MVMKAWVRDRFTKHELWALTLAERWPFFALFFAATLWVWALPLVPVLAFFVLGTLRWPLVTFVPGLVLGMALCFFVAPWFFRWYFVSVGLMFGRTGMARRKSQSLLQRLEKW
jgi:hypothetical protein